MGSAIFVIYSSLTILWLALVVSTTIAYVHYRKKKRKEEAKKGGCLSFAIVLSILGTFLVFSLVVLSIVHEERRTQPDKMLSEFLKVKDVSNFHSMRSDLSGGEYYTARVYFETTTERFNKLVSDLNFRRLSDGKPNRGLDSSGFSDAPDLPLLSNAVVYYRESPDNYDAQYIVTDDKHQCGWFVSINY